jgi:phosphohistidine swiveling domain-containing protein
MTALGETWTFDPSHYPEPMSPLSADVWFFAMGEGIQAAARELAAPFGGFTTMLHDGWAYEHELEPVWTFDPERFENAALEIAGRWEREYRPRVEEITSELRSLRPERPPAAGASVLLDRLVELVLEQWRLHFLTVIPVHAAREVLHDAWVERFGKRDELEPYALIEGLPNETLEADEQLWAIGQRARTLDVADVILELPTKVALERLRALQGGRELLAELDRYLLRFGGRSRLHELSEPRDAEEPGRALSGVRLFLERPRDLPAERRARSDERDRLQTETLARIEDEHDRARFAELLERVVAAVPLEETHTYYIDYPGLQATREALLGFGRRLVAEARLDAAGDVFMLRLAELREAVLEDHGPGLQALVAERRRELEEAKATSPSSYLGPPPEHVEVPVSVAKFYGVAGSARVDGDLIVGTGASTGSAEGIARVVHGTEDFARVERGDVLVCTTTTPAWTPLFGAIGGLVTDTGGILSHAAVVAREYGVPTVVGAEVATRLIPDGARVSVDGETGEVRILRS